MIAYFILFCLAPHLLENFWSEAAFGFSGGVCVCVTISQMEKWGHREIRTSTGFCGEPLAQPKLEFSFLLFTLLRSTASPALQLSKFSDWGGTAQVWRMQPDFGIISAWTRQECCGSTLVHTVGVWVCECVKQPGCAAGLLPCSLSHCQSSLALGADLGLYTKTVSEGEPCCKHKSFHIHVSQEP